MVNPPMHEQLKTNTLVGFLEGEARDLIEEMQDADKNSYSKIVELLRSHFESPHFRSLARQQLSDCKQLQTETARDFAERIKKLVKKVTKGQPRNAQNERLLDEFLDRLKPALRFHVKASNPQNFDDAVIKAITYESLLADVAGSLSILPGVQAATAAVNVISNSQNGTRFEGRNEEARNDYRKRQVRNYSNNFNRRRWERAPNSNVVCYRCGKSGHIQTFCRFSLPPANLRPPRQQFPIRNNFRSNRMSQNSQERSGYNSSLTQQSSNPHQRSEARNSSRVLALEQTSTVKEPNPRELSIIEQKDAHIAALIDRNNALADIAFATRNQNLQESREESSAEQPSSRRLTPVATPSKLTYSCMLAVALLACVSATDLPPAHVCSPKSPMSYWKIPSEINCTKILPNWSATAQPLKLKVFRPNTVRYKSTVNVCRIITETVIYSVNFFGARSQKTISQEQTVSTGVCRHMVSHKACVHGDLTAVGTVLKTLNKIEIEWPSAPFHCCTDYSTTVSNCIVFQATVYAYHGSPNIESSIGPLEGCQYKDGACTTKSGSAIIWEPEKQESCRYVLVSPMKGVLVDKVWLSNSKEFALSFSLNDLHFSDCGHSLIPTDQGYAIELYSDITRQKRQSDDTILQQVGLATTNQLAAQLLAVEDNMQNSLSTSFHHSILSLCKSVNSLSASLVAAISANPTIAMRNVLQRSDIEAKFLGNNVVRTKACAAINFSMSSLSTFNSSCFS